MDNKWVISINILFIKIIIFDYKNYLIYDKFILIYNIKIKT